MAAVVFGAGAAADVAVNAVAAAVVADVVAASTVAAGAETVVAVVAAVGAGTLPDSCACPSGSFPSADPEIPSTLHHL